MFKPCQSKYPFPLSEGFSLSTPSVPCEYIELYGALPSRMLYLPVDVRRAPIARQETVPPRISVALRIWSRVRGHSDRANVTTRLVDELVSPTTLSSSCGSRTQARNRRSTCPLLSSRSSLSGLLTHGAVRIHVRRTAATIHPGVGAPPVWAEMNRRTCLKPHYERMHWAPSKGWRDEEKAAGPRTLMIKVRRFRDPGRFRMGSGSS